MNSIARSPFYHHSFLCEHLRCEHECELSQLESVVVCYERVAGIVVAVKGVEYRFGQPVARYIKEDNEFTCIDYCLFASKELPCGDEMFLFVIQLQLERVSITVNSRWMLKGCDKHRTEYKTLPATFSSPL
jgi:hypothetical protein